MNNYDAERTDFTNKTRSLMREAYRNQLSSLRFVIQNEDTFRHHVGEHGQDYQAPRNFLTAVAMDTALEYSPPGSTIRIINDHNRQDPAIIRKMNDRLPSIRPSERAVMPETEALKACVKFIDSIIPHLDKVPANIGLLNDALLMARPLIEEGTK